MISLSFDKKLKPDPLDSSRMASHASFHSARSATRYVGKVMQLCQEHRGHQMDHATMGSQRTMLRHTLPLPELAGDFYDNLKSLTSGYATFEYEESGHQPADLVKVRMPLPSL